jgi:hypothetical protein
MTPVHLYSNHNYFTDIRYIFKFKTQHIIQYFCPSVRAVCGEDLDRWTLRSWVRISFKSRLFVLVFLCFVIVCS